MTRGVGSHARANHATHLQGIHVPADRKAIARRTTSNEAPREVMEEIEAMPEQDDAAVAEMMKAFGQSQESGGQERDR